MEGITIGILLNSFEYSFIIDWESIRLILQNSLILMFIALILLAFFTEVFSDVKEDFNKRIGYSPESFIEKGNEVNDNHYPTFANKVILSNKKSIKPKNIIKKVETSTKLKSKLITLEELKKFRKKIKKVKKHGKTKSNS